MYCRAPALVLALLVSTARAELPDSRHWSQDTSARSKDRKTSEGAHDSEFGTQPKGVVWWFTNAGQRWQPSVPDEVTDDTDLLVAVTFKPNEDDDHFEFSGKEDWNAVGAMIGKIPASHNYCDTRKAPWSML
jgi:hypothetical protein